MPEIPDGRANNGGNRQGSGRKKKLLSERLAHLFDEAWPEEDRAGTIKESVLSAEAGDINLLRLLLAYTYGTPPSGDDLMVQEEVDNAIEKLLAKLEKNLSAQSWTEVKTVLRI